MRAGCGGSSVISAQPGARRRGRRRRCVREVVIHLAGAVRGDRSLEAVAPTLRANLVGHRGTARGGDAGGLPTDRPERLVARGAGRGRAPGRSAVALRRVSLGGERVRADVPRLFDAPVVILRPSFAYGPGQEPTKLIPHVITALLEGRSPELSSGERLLDCVYAEDVARAYVEAASAAGVEGRTIDIGSGVLTSVREIVRGDRRGGRDRPPEQPEFGALPVRPLEQQVEVDVDEAAARARLAGDDEPGGRPARHRRLVSRPPLRRPRSSP